MASGLVLDGATIMENACSLPERCEDVALDTALRVREGRNIGNMASRL